jgi:hypothetical protein
VFNFFSLFQCGCSTSIMTEPNPYDLQAILDKGETAESMMIQEEINAIMFAPYDRGNNKPKAKKKKPKSKQTTLKQAFKNAIPKNFQGFPEKNCIAVMLKGKAELVYCPKGYGKAQLDRNMARASITLHPIRFAALTVTWFRAPFWSSLMNYMRNYLLNLTSSMRKLMKMMTIIVQTSSTS